MPRSDAWQINNAAFLRYLLSRSDFPFEPVPLPFPGDPSLLVRPTSRVEARDADTLTKMVLPVMLLGLGVLLFCK
jgi:hypothetical protein